MELSKILKGEINTYSGYEPNVKLFVDESSIFWVTKGNEFVWIADHNDLSNYIDDTHNAIDEKTPEGVSNCGVYWMNEDFESPFHISDFEQRIEQINAIRI